MALSTELHAFLTSMTGARTPSFAATMWLVAGSTMSWLADAKSSRSTSSGARPWVASSFSAAATARSEASQSSGSTWTCRTPVRRETIGTRGAAPGLRSASARSASRTSTTRSGRWTPTAAITAAGRTGADPGATGRGGFSGTRDTVAKQTLSDGGRPQVPMG